jgi:NAD(P)-dependent dehydrogenase (short-subunit alcohol dehydrogenase family)
VGRFDGMTIVVTGAASGIGLATVRRLLEDGAGVVGCDLGPGNEMPDGTGGYTFVTADVTDEDAVAEVFAAAPGRITGVVHSAGVARGGPVHLLDRAEWDRVITINLTGTFLVTKAALVRMVDQERGGRRAGLHRHAGKRGRHRGHCGRQLLQRLEGWRRAVDQEHRHRPRSDRDPLQRYMSRLR